MDLSKRPATGFPPLTHAGFLRHMTQQEKIVFKSKLKQFCHAMIEQRIHAVKDAMANAQQAANSEEKSSAGDKYETSRAMGHLEKDMHARQLAENLRELAGLDAVAVHTVYHSVTTGAFVQCAGISFFIAAGLGRQSAEGKTILFLSPHAPLARQMQYKKTGDSFLFADVNTVIVDLY
jgi:transcription elongation GreA/GreB family factor